MTDDTLLYNRFNYDDIFNRSVIAGLLNLMNNEIVYEQIWQNNVVESVSVPCMFDFGSSDERFAQDNYTFFGRACFGGNKIDGKFDMLPRCAVKYSGSQIDSGNITNRFVKGTYMKNENGKLVSYSSFLYSIPITFNFDCEIWVENLISAFKIEQSIREVFYKNKTFNVLYKGMRIACCAGFPESIATEKTVSYAFDTERQIKMTFALAVEAYQPVFDNSMAMPTSKKMKYIGWDVDMPDGADADISYVKFKNITNEYVYPAGTNVMLEWENFSTIYDFASISLEYIDEDGTTHQIDTLMDNQQSYIWRIPSNDKGFKYPEVVFMNTDDMYVIETPEIKVVPCADRSISESSFVIVNPGLFSKDGQIGFTVEYIDDEGNLKVSNINSYKFNIKNRKIDYDNPVSIEDWAMQYDGTVQYRTICLRIYYPLKPEICDEIHNILIL